MLKSFKMLGLEGDEIFVTDKWMGTLSAVKTLREEKGWTEASFRHEIVCHSDGEIVNSRGFTTNHVEA
eukprot:5149011-Karenia_brevis.AAC.1